jgi:hypothetical protein
MGDEFVKEQKRRHEKRLRDQIYDVTGWSMPLLFGIDCFAAEQASAGDFEALRTPVKMEGEIRGSRSKLAYLLPWTSNSVARALALLFRRGIRVFSTDEPFVINNVRYPRGSLVVKVKNNPDDLHEQLSEVAAQAGVVAYSTDTAWVDEGVNLGSNNVVFLKRPKIGMVYGPPTRSSSVGATRYLFERVYEYPVTIIPTERLGRTELSRYNVLVFPEASQSLGGYSGFLGEPGIRRLKEWIQDGGTLITLGEATSWLTSEKVALLDTKSEYKERQEEEPQDSSAGNDSGKEEAPEKKIELERERPDYTPGALMRVSLDTEHWLAYGYDGQAKVMVNSRRIFTPLKLDKGRNVATYMPEDHLVASGFTWESARKQLAKKAYLMYQRRGNGHVVAFAEDPNFRAFMDGLNLLFLNAAFFGPAH